MTEGTGVEGVPSYEKLNLGETLPVEEQSILTRRNNSVESKKYLDNLKNTYSKYLKNNGSINNNIILN